MHIQCIRRQADCPLARRARVTSGSLRALQFLIYSTFVLIGVMDLSYCHNNAPNNACHFRELDPCGNVNVYRKTSNKLRRRLIETRR